MVENSKLQKPLSDKVYKQIEKQYKIYKNKKITKSSKNSK